MRARHRYPQRPAYACLFLSLLIPAASSYDSRAIAPKQGQKQEADHTIHINVGLCQTDVMVFDRHGRFVPNLKMDQFELRIDGKVQPISFLELVSAGSSHDEEVWVREEAKPVPPPPPAAVTNANAGRTLMFFLDDWHMDAENVVRARAALAKLVNTEMGPKDRVAIFAASGQLGSAQQLTSDKAALLASLAKFNFQSAGVQDLQWPPMTEGQAFLIEQNDQDVIAYFCSAMQGTNWDNFPSASRGGCSAQLIQTIQHRAAQLASTSAAIGERTLSARRDLVRSNAALPGRKVIFFLSDGFVLQPQRGDVVDSLRQMTIAAARLGIIIYTLDTRGLVVGLPDAKTKRAADTTGALAHSGYSEVLSQQDALNALAADTGGRFLKNTNALDTAMITTLSEISRYYLLAWPFDPEVVKPGKYSTIHVAVKGHSDFTARVRQGSLDLSQLIAKRKTETANASALQPVSILAPRPASSTEMEIYTRARTVVDMTRAELLGAYSFEFRNLEFEESQADLDTLLEKVGEKVAVFFHDFPNTVSSEQVRRERLQYDGTVQDAVTQNFNYSVSVDKMGRLDEGRTDSGGRAIAPERMSDYSFLTSGFVSLPIYFQPSRQFGSRFRYLGRERAESRAYVIAFAQRPGVADVVGEFGPTAMRPGAQLLYQGFAWVDPQTYQIVRMKTDLLAPRDDVMLARVSSEIWFNEMHFKTIAEAFWLPQEVEVALEFNGKLYRNRHRYSDYQVLTVAAHDKITPPIIKK
jgi:VWFA-related protein